MLKTKIGYSVNPDSFLSGKETATKALEGYKEPKVGIVACGWQYEEEKFLEGVKSISGTLPLIGCTSAGAIIVPDGIITSKEGFSGMMLFDDENLKVSVAGSEAGKDARAIGKEIAVEAIKKAGIKTRPSYMYMVASPKEEEEYLKGIQDVVGRVPCFGGSCADDDLNGEGRILCNDKAFADGCAVAFFYSDKKIVNEYTGAYTETENRGIITKVDGKRKLVEIDNIPALEKYASWIGKTPAELQGMNLLVESITKPLAVKDVLGSVTAVRHPMNGNEDFTMNIGNNLEVGTSVVLLEGSVDGLVASTKDTLEKAKENLDVEAAGFFLVHCGGRKLGVGDRLEEVYANLKEAAGTTPFMTVFTFGEYGYADHSANTCGGLMLSFTGFAKGE